MTALQRVDILALHGFTGVGADFTPFAKLCGGTWHCPNLPGHGPDPQLACTPEATVKFIHSQYSGLRSQPSSLRPVLLGYSMGARAALLHALKYPNFWDALVLISPNPGIESEAARDERCRTDDKLAARIEQDGVPAFLEFWQNTPMIRSQQQIRSDWLANMRAHRRTHTAAGLSSSLRAFGQGRCQDLWPELPRLTLPTLLLCGAEDAKYTAIAERMHRLLGNCKNLQIEGVGHMPHLEAPSICAALVKQFLTGS